MKITKKMVERTLIMSWTYNPNTFHRTEHYFTSRQKAIRYYKNKVVKKEPVILYILNHNLGILRSWSEFKDGQKNSYRYGDWKAYFDYWKNKK